MSKPTTRNTAIPNPEADERRVLADKIDNLEIEIEHIKKYLGDDTVMNSLRERISNCEALAGIVPPISPKAEEN